MSDQPLRIELESRVLAMINGELTPDETAELEQLIARDPALAAYRDEMSVLIGDINESDQFFDEDDDKAIPTRLSPARRKAVLDAARENQVAEDDGKQVRFHNPFRSQKWNGNLLIASAASIILTCTLIYLFSGVTFYSEMRPEEPELEAPMVVNSVQEKPASTLEPAPIPADTLLARPQARPVVMTAPSRQSDKKVEVVEIYLPELDVDVPVVESQVAVGTGIVGGRGAFAGEYDNRSELVINGSGSVDFLMSDDFSKFGPTDLTETIQKQPGATIDKEGDESMYFGFAVQDESQKLNANAIEVKQGSTEELGFNWAMNGQDKASGAKDGFDRLEKKSGAQFAQSNVSFFGIKDDAPAKPQSEFQNRSSAIDEGLVRARASLLYGDLEAADEQLKDLQMNSPADPRIDELKQQYTEMREHPSIQDHEKTRDQMLSEVSRNWQRPQVYADQAAQVPQAPRPSAAPTGATTISGYAGGANAFSMPSEGVAANADPFAAPTGEIAASMDPFAPPQRQSQSRESAPARSDVDFLPISTKTLQQLTGIEYDQAAASADPFAAPTAASSPMPNQQEEALRNFFTRAGIDFDDSGTSLAFDGTQIIVEQTPENVEKMRRLVDRAGETASESGQIMASQMADPLDEKLKKIYIPRVSFTGVPLSKVMETLSELSAEYDPEVNSGGKGVNLVYLDPNGNDPLVSITLRNLSLDRIIDFTTESVGVTWDISDDVVVVSRGSHDSAIKLETWTFPISQAMVSQLTGLGTHATTEEVNTAFRNFFTRAGIDHASEDNTLRYDGKQLIVTQTPRNLQKLGNILRRYDSVAAVVPKPKPQVPLAEKSAAEEPFSTFSLNVSDVSFRVAESALQANTLPSPSEVRAEEFVNALPPVIPTTAAQQDVRFDWELSEFPMEHNRQLLRFAVQASSTGRLPNQPANLVIVLDASGSMQRPDRQEILQKSLNALIGELNPQDRISAVVFARTPRVVADGVSGAAAGDVVQRVLSQTPEGGTNLETALREGYALARRHYKSGGINRVILLTDGAANLGQVNADQLRTMAVDNRKSGIALDAFGVGWDGYNDELLEALTRNSDGRYAFLNSPATAATDFADKIVGALNLAAADVKVQVEWNPRRVLSYRQIGYEKHQLKKEDFRNNAVDAAELSAAEAGQALYVVQLDPDAIGGLGTLRVRYRDPATGEYQELAWPLEYPAQIALLDKSSTSHRLAAAGALLADKLAQTPQSGNYTLSEVDALTSGLAPNRQQTEVAARLRTMIQQARHLLSE